MAHGEKANRGPVWLDDRRREPRWLDSRTALIQVRGEDYLGKVRDISLGGLGIDLREALAIRGEDVKIFVVYERRVLEVRGRIVHAAPGRDRILVGMTYDSVSETALDFLRSRYEASAPPDGAAE